MRVLRILGLAMGLPLAVLAVWVWVVQKNDAITYSAAPAASAAAAPTGVTLAQFEQLQTDMTYEEAVKVLGRAGVEHARSELPGAGVTVIYSWPGAGSPGANMNATFQNYRLVAKG